jgi:drug/metabolite transporter (DMT)-like permease
MLQINGLLQNTKLTLQEFEWPKWSIDVLLVFVTIIWGSTYLVVQNTVRLSGPFTFLTLRFSIAALAMGILFRNRIRNITRLDVIAGSLIGVFLFAGYALQTTGLQFTTTSKAGFITGLYVPLVPILVVIIMRQWPHIGGVIGVVLSATGLTLLSINENFSLVFGVGELLVLASALAMALHIVTVGKFAPKADAINLTMVQIVVVAVLSLVMIFPSGEALAMPVAEVWWSALFMGIVASAFALAIMNWIQKSMSSTRATLFYALEPVWAGFFGYMTGESLTIPAFIGCGLILLGMVVSERKIRK